VVCSLGGTKERSNAGAPLDMVQDEHEIISITLGLILIGGRKGLD